MTAAKQKVRDDGFATIEMIQRIQTNLFELNVPRGVAQIRR